MKSVDFYYDYLGSTQIERVAAEKNATVVFKPFLLGALFKAIGTPLVPIATFPEAKRRYQEIDMKRWAKHWNVTLKWPSNFPLNTVHPLRLTLAVDDSERSALTHRLMKLCWVEDRVPDEAGMRECLADVGLDPELVAKTSDPEIKQRLFTATQEAVDLGVCGAPTCVVDGELYWGQDRLHFVSDALG